MPLLALTPAPPPALICTIESVQSHWDPAPIASVRVPEGMQFVIQTGPPVRVDPRYVIDSRLTLLAREHKSVSGLHDTGGRIVYRWEFDAPLGPVAADLNETSSAQPALAVVQGQLTLESDHRFKLVNTSTVTSEQSGATITQLKEHADGTCREPG